jgi:hypothetical protein
MDDKVSASDAIIQMIVADMPDTLYQSFINLIQHEPHIVLVQRVTGRIELLLHMSSEIDLVLLAMEKATMLPGIASHLLSEYPELKILVLGTSDTETTIYWRGLRSQAFNSGFTADLPRQLRAFCMRNPIL